MFIFGHLGIGLRLVRPISARKGRRDEKIRLPIRWILLGTLLPDLIDKSLFYGLLIAVGRERASGSFISGTRTFGHAAIFTILVTAIAAWRRSRVLAALSLGMASHLLLDNVGDRIVLGRENFSLRGLLWPFAGVRFPVFPYHSLAGQLHRATEPFYFWAELLGFFLLIPEIWPYIQRGPIKRWMKF
ncbi:MAG: metal-dependent hydrolase [Oligoflexia bacterium]|nr:metal-dependent hydrolase [Oligoflexia bacterium]